ncbi:MAG: hypothetical protein ACRDUY_12790 [Nitriliruptorales bacterium]
MSPDTLTIVATQILTTLGIVYFLVTRMDALGRDLRQEFGARFDRVEARIDALSARIDAHIERHPS